MKALAQAVEIAGGQAELARRITGKRKPPIKQAHVWNWLHRDKKVPPDVVLDIERETGVSRHDLSPTIYPREQAAA